MAICFNCGGRNADTVRFCTRCGKPTGGGVPAAPVQAASGSTGKVGNIRKCPSCGAALESFQARCPSCNHELNTVQVASSMQVFVKKLERATSYAEQIEQIEMIESFPIPNSKEDIFEFAIMAVTKLKPGSKTNDAWETKLKQVYLKAQLSFDEDKSSLEKLKNIISEGGKSINSIIGKK